MNPEVAPTRPRYRNEVVYRSAERLLSSRPKPPARKLPVWPVTFLAGLICGLGIATLWLLPVRRTDAPAPNFATRRPAPTASVNNRSAPARSAQRDSLPTPAATLAAPSAAAADTEPATPAIAPESPPATPQPPALQLPPPPPVVASPATATMTATTTTALHFASVVVLHGRQFSGALPPLEVHFLLYLTRAPHGATVTGSVRYFDHGVLVSYHRLMGSIENLTIHLTEVTAPVRGAITPPPRRFEIPIPAEPTVSKFHGTWMRGAAHGRIELELLQPF